MQINLILTRLRHWLGANSLEYGTKLTDIFSSQACGPLAGYDEWAVADYFEQRIPQYADGSILEPADKILAFLVWFMCMSTKPRNTMWISGFANPEIVRIGLLDVDVRRVLLADGRDYIYPALEVNIPIRRPKLLGREPKAFFTERPFGTLIFGDCPPTREIAGALAKLDCRLDSHCECLVVESSGPKNIPPGCNLKFSGFDPQGKSNLSAELPRRDGGLVQLRYYRRVN